jgi:hypothetical protein
MMAGEMAQFNVRMDAKLLDDYKRYCEENGLDPHQQVVLYIKKVLEMRYNFQDRLYEQMLKGKKER